MQIDVRALTFNLDKVGPVLGSEQKSNLNQGFMNPEASQVSIDGTETKVQAGRSAEVMQGSRLKIMVALTGTG